MAHRIKLVFSTPSIVRYRNDETLRLAVTASNGTDMPDEIFLHQKSLVDVNTDLECDEFVAICSPYDLSIYPANEPDEDQIPPFFRKATLDILLPGVGTLVDVQADIEKQVCRLISLLDDLDTVSEVTEVWCPNEPSSDELDIDGECLEINDNG